MIFVLTHLHYALMWVIIFLICGVNLALIMEKFSVQHQIFFFSPIQSLGSSNLSEIYLTNSSMNAHIYIQKLIHSLHKYVCTMICMMKLCIMHVLCY